MPTMIIYRTTQRPDPIACHSESTLAEQCGLDQGRKIHLLVLKWQKAEKRFRRVHL